MFTHLLIPVDFTQKNDAAIQVATELAIRDAARVTLLHVIETIDNTESEEFANFYELLREKSTTQMASVAAPLEAAGIEVLQRIAFGKPLAEVVRESVDEPIDLVVVSSHKVEAARGASGWGTLSYQLSVLCPCPVLLVK